VADRVPASLQAALADVMKWLDASHIPSMVIGGVASSMLGRPRLTQDVDALVLLPEGEWAKALSSANNHGIVPRIEDPLGFAASKKSLRTANNPQFVDREPRHTITRPR
jgi:hypothetical protein